MSRSTLAYSELLAELWREAEDFLVVEHDIELTAEALREALECPCEWSTSPFPSPGPSPFTMSLGCTRFRKSLMEQLPQAVDRANRIDDSGSVCPPGHWKLLDARLYSVLRGTAPDLRSPHLHSPVPHHHEYPR